MAKHIIGIHGLSEKPPASELEPWWHTSINDGLARIGAPPLDRSRFSLAYWAHHRYKDDLEHGNPQPYTTPETDTPVSGGIAFVQAAKKFSVNWLGEKLDEKYEHQGEGEIRKWLKEKMLAHSVADLHAYYDEGSTVEHGEKLGMQTRQALRNELKLIIDRHANDELLVVGHSMGSVVAYDVLRDLSPAEHTIAHYISIGSPLGIADVKFKITQERRENQATVPEVLTESWLNFADPRDFVAIDVSIADEYANPRNIRIEDMIVHNGYRAATPKGDWDENPHKSYGYLRTQEVAHAIEQFMSAD